MIIEIYIISMDRNWLESDRRYLKSTKLEVFFVVFERGFWEGAGGRNAEGIKARNCAESLIVSF